MAASYYKTLLHLAKTYDDMIDFQRYYSLMFPGKKLIPGPVPCEIHRETHGASFSYRASDGICSCFGECKFTGRVVGFHLKYMKTLMANYKLLDALRNLHIMFPMTPDPDAYVDKNAHKFTSVPVSEFHYDFKTAKEPAQPSRTYSTFDEAFLAILLAPTRDDEKRRENSGGIL